MRVGKLSSDELNECILSKLKHRRTEVLAGAALGEDCAAFKCEDTLLISTDPITGETDSIGSLAIKVATNDIYAAGGEPMLVTVALIAPTDALPIQLSKVMAEAEAEAKRLNVEIVGGHTEFSTAVNRIIASVTAVGRTSKHIKSTSICIGDSLVVTKSVGIEGAALLAETYRKKLTASLGEKAVSEAIDAGSQISVKGESAVALSQDISAMHDVTEGGVFGAVCEMCESAGLGAEISVKDIPISDVTRAICGELSINPYRLVSSGSMLIATKKPSRLISALAAEGIKATKIGTITDGKPVALYEDGNEEVLKVTADEFFENTKQL